MEIRINSICRKRSGREREREKRNQTHAKLVAPKPRQKYSEIVLLFHGSCLSPPLQCWEINCFRCSVFACLCTLFNIGGAICSNVSGAFATHFWILLTRLVRKHSFVSECFSAGGLCPHPPEELLEGCLSNEQAPTSTHPTTPNICFLQELIACLLRVLVRVLVAF